MSLELFFTRMNTTEQIVRSRSFACRIVAKAFDRVCLIECLAVEMYRIPVTPLCDQFVEGIFMQKC